MKKNLTFIFITLFWLISLQAVVSAQGLSSSELINHAKQYEDKLVVYSGEVIGELMPQGEFTWVNIHDGENALGVWINSGLVKDIKFTGNYKTRGDSVEVTGILHRACAEHGGELDIHAQSLRKTGHGRIVKEKLNFDKVTLSLILLGALFFIWILTLFKHK
ncbi:MAG: DNA-binding protein [Candidatus Omnitrophica bacterium CG11_big_fil_rev_8_21_14_0_20_43_6]|nr:MAG: DNA-binding protein [Candidatus Omnitrophica bacterium CG11_big_fil_rev_8_21_14_0_20_43_6]